MKEKIDQLVGQYLKQKGRRKMHHIEIDLLAHDGRFWIIDEALITGEENEGGVRLAIYWSYNPESRKGKRVAQSIDLLEPFKNYQQAVDGRHTVYYLATNNKSSFISNEVANVIQTLFPALDLSHIAISAAWDED